MDLSRLAKTTLQALETPTSKATDHAVGDTLNGFGKMLSEQLNKVNDLDTQADQAAKTFAVGGGIPLHQVMIAGEKASTALNLTMQIRNKLVAAYQEVSHMGI